MAHAPLKNHLLLGQRVALVNPVRGGFEPGHGRVRTGVIGQHQVVFVFGVRKPVEDAFFFKQAADEVEVGLAVLHAIAAWFGAAGGLVDHAAAVLGKDLLDDGDRRLVLEHPQIGRPCQQPQPGPCGDAVGGMPAVAALDAKGRHDAVEPALGARAQVDRHGHRLAQQAVGRDGEVVRYGNDLVLKKARDFL